MRQELCKLSEVPAGGSIVVPFFGREAHVYRASGKVRAAANVCMHLGGPLECKDGKFICPWHGARFDMSSGTRIDGPAPKEARLMLLPTLVDDGSLFYIWGE